MCIGMRALEYSCRKLYLISSLDLDMILCTVCKQLSERCKMYIIQVSLKKFLKQFPDTVHVIVGMNCLLVRLLGHHHGALLNYML